MLKFARLVCLLLLVGGCAAEPEKELPDIVTFDEIIGYIFDAEMGRLENTGSYETISGEIAATFSGSETSGKFTFSYSNFSIPSLCSYMQNCACTGVLKGSFVAGEEPAGEAPPEGPYNPLDPKVDEQTQTPNPSITTKYIDITIDYQGSSLSSGCPQQSSRKMKLQVHNDKKLVVTDMGKDLVFAPRAIRR